MVHLPHSSVTLSELLFPGLAEAVFLGQHAPSHFPLSSPWATLSQKSVHVEAGHGVLHSSCFSSTVLPLRIHLDTTSSQKVPFDNTLTPTPPLRGVRTPGAPGNARALTLAPDVSCSI